MPDPAPYTVPADLMDHLGTPAHLAVMASVAGQA